jgi:hypothetical protein
MPRGPVAAATTSGKGAAKPAGPADLGTPDSQAPARPIDLRARTVEARILRSPVKNTIDDLWCEGSVEVHQDPAKAEEKPTHIKGDTLKMLLKSLPGVEPGYEMVVTGDLAEVETDRIYILGPEVNLDQTTNRCWVPADGAMRMVSATNFQGEKLEKPVPLTVHWGTKMYFDGNSCIFVGSIQAEQEKARLACQHLQVFFDRPISLREGNKSDQPAKVKKMVADQEVRVEDSTYEKGKLVKVAKLEALELDMDALEPDDDRPLPAGKSAGNKVRARGPGHFQSWEPGSADPLGPDQPGAKKHGGAATSKKPAAPPGSGAQQAPQMKMTYVAFQRRMDANSQTNMAYFWERVRVLSLPWEKHDKPIDLDVLLANDLPEGALYLSCDRLKVMDRPTDGKPNKQMEGHGNVYVQGREFYARGGSVYYNQQKQQIILDGNEVGQATLYRVITPGAPPDVLVGKKIIYNRATGETQVLGASGIQGESLPGRK